MNTVNLTKPKSLRHRTTYEGRPVNVHYHIDGCGAVQIEDVRDEHFRFVSMNINAQKRVKAEIAGKG